MKKSTAPLIVGLVLLFVGCAFVGNAFFDFNISLYFKGWWTLFIIVPAFISIIVNKPHSYNIIPLIIGILLLLEKQDILTFRSMWILIVSSILLGIGVAFIVHYFRGSNPVIISGSGNVNYTTPDYVKETKEPNGNFSNESSEYPVYNAIFSDVKVKNIATDFKGTKSTALFGKLTIDLRDIKCTSDIKLYFTSVFGDVKVYMPKNVKISFAPTNIFGSTKCTAQAMGPETDVYNMHLDCTAVFGDVKIY